MQIKILSWNIWVDGNFQQLKDFLSTANADVIGLQEVKDDDPERDVIGYLTGLGYQQVFARTEQEWDGKIYRHGPAIFSKFPIINSGAHLLDKEDERATAWADIEIDGKIIHVFSTHLIHTHQKPSAQQETQTARLIEKLPKDHVIVMGDFNATPESNAIKKMEKILKNVAGVSNPTWSLYKEGCSTCKIGDLRYCLDYIFVTKDIETHSFKIESSRASDHLPISVIIEV